MEEQQQQNQPAAAEIPSWERAWSIDELRQASMSTWNLATDAGLLNYLQQFSDNLVARTNEVGKEVDGLVLLVKNTDVSVRNSFNQFLHLSNKQFVENRVYDEEITKPDETPAEKKEADMSFNELEAVLTPKYMDAIASGMKTLENSSLATVDEFNFEEKINVLDKFAKNPLPFIIGTKQFYEDEYCGLAIGKEEEIVESFDESEIKEETKIIDDDFDKLSDNEDGEKDKKKKKKERGEFSDTDSDIDIDDNNSDSEKEEKSDDEFVDKPIIPKPPKNNDYNDFSDENDEFDDEFEDKVPSTPQEALASALNANLSQRLSGQTEAPSIIEKRKKRNEEKGFFEDNAPLFGGAPDDGPLFGGSNDAPSFSAKSSSLFDNNEGELFGSMSKKKEAPKGQSYGGDDLDFLALPQEKEEQIIIKEEPKRGVKFGTQVLPPIGGGGLFGGGDEDENSPWGSTSIPKSTLPSSSSGKSSSASSSIFDTEDLFDGSAKKTEAPKKTTSSSSAASSLFDGDADIFGSNPPAAKSTPSAPKVNSSSTFDDFIFDSKAPVETKKETPISAPKSSAPASKSNLFSFEDDDDPLFGPSTKAPAKAPSSSSSTVNKSAASSATKSSTFSSLFDGDDDDPLFGNIGKAPVKAPAAQPEKVPEKVEKPADPAPAKSSAPKSSSSSSVFGEDDGDFFSSLGGAKSTPAPTSAPTPAVPSPAPSAATTKTAPPIEDDFFSSFISKAPEKTTTPAVVKKEEKSSTFDDFLNTPPLPSSSDPLTGSDNIIIIEKKEEKKDNLPKSSKIASLQGSLGLNVEALLPGANPRVSKRNVEDDVFDNDDNDDSGLPPPPDFDDTPSPSSISYTPSSAPLPSSSSRGVTNPPVQASRLHTLTKERPQNTSKRPPSRLSSKQRNKGKSNKENKEENKSSSSPLSSSSSSVQPSSALMSSVSSILEASSDVKIEKTITPAKQEKKENNVDFLFDSLASSKVSTPSSTTKKSTGTLDIFNPTSTPKKSAKNDIDDFFADISSTPKTKTEKVETKSPAPSSAPPSSSTPKVNINIDDMFDDLPSGKKTEKKVESKTPTAAKSNTLIDDFFDTASKSTPTKQTEKKAATSTAFDDIFDSAPKPTKKINVDDIFANSPSKASVKPEEPKDKFDNILESNSSEKDDILSSTEISTTDSPKKKIVKKKVIKKVVKKVVKKSTDSPA